MFRNANVLLTTVCLSGLTACSSARRPAAGEGPAWSVEARSISREAVNPAENARDELIKPDSPLSLSNAISTVLSCNPELRAYAWDLRAAEARRTQAGLHPNPELELGVEEFLGRDERDGFDGAEATVSLTQPIEVGGKRGKRSRVAAGETKLIQMDYELARLTLVRRTRQAFIEVLDAQQKVELAGEHTRVAEALLETVNKRVEAGRGSVADAAGASVVLSQARLERQHAVAELADSRYRLAILWGGEEPVFGRVVPPPDRPTELPSRPELMQEVERHPLVLRCREEIALARARLKLEKARSLPDLGLTAGLKRLGQDDDNTGILGLSLPLPVFDRNQGMIAAARHELAKAEELRGQVLTQVRARLAASHQRLQAVLASAALLKEDVLTGAQAVYETTRTAYREGRFGYLQLLEAQRTLLHAQSQALDAQIAVRLAWNDVDFAIGRIAGR